MTTNELPEKIEISDDISKQLLELNRKTEKLSDKQNALNNIIQQSQESWNRSGVEYQAESRELRSQGQKIWSQVAAKYGLDMEHVNYDLSEDGKFIVPIMVRLK